MKDDGKFHVGDIIICKDDRQGRLTVGRLYKVVIGQRCNLVVIEDNGKEYAISTYVQSSAGFRKLKDNDFYE